MSLTSVFDPNSPKHLLWEQRRKLSPEEWEIHEVAPIDDQMVLEHLLEVTRLVASVFFWFCYNIQLTICMQFWTG